MTEPGVQLEQTREILNPITGELVPVHDLQRVAESVEILREAKRNLDDVIAAFTEATIEESKRLGTRTLTAGGIKLVVSSDTEVEWDVTALSALRDAGLPEERMNELVKAKVEWKVDALVAKQLAASNPEYKRIIDAAQTRVPAKQYVSIKRS